MSDTPETDNERTLKLALEVFTQLANHLKQERDEAREALREAIQFRDTTLNGYDLDAWLKAAGLKP
jgi:hypothetical protein